MVERSISKEVQYLTTGAVLHALLENGVPLAKVNQIRAFKRENAGKRVKMTRKKNPSKN